MTTTQARADILEVISNLSSDEVFTPPHVANAVLDLLPEEVWSDKTLRWLDPGTKTGVFLREITRRLMAGLESEIPNEDKRREHIIKEMVFGIAITELTSLMARRSVYCSKDASGDRSIVEMPTNAGNIWFGRVEHSFDHSGRCEECKASRDQLERGEERENYAYGFIHEDGRDKISEEMDMQFDVIVGNPPYQLDDAGGHRPVPIYNRFVDQALELNARFVLMVTPSRWMAGGLGLSDYRSRMLSDTRIRTLVDYPVASEIFAGVEIKGGVNYFLWDRDNPGSCAVTTKRGEDVAGPTERALDQFDVLVRDSRALPILEKVLEHGDPPFEGSVASVRPFGDQLRSNFKKFRKTRGGRDDLKLYMNEGSARRQYWVPKLFVTNNIELANAWKVYLPTAGSDGGQRLPDLVVGRPLIGEPRSVCTETYLAIGPFESQDEAKHALSFLRTRFARFLISLRKPAQHNVPSTFRWVPQQPWNKAWTDQALYKKYGITDEEQAYIAEMVKEMPE